MGGSLKDLVKKINDVGDKTKKIADIVYLFGLVFFIVSKACGGSRLVYVDFVRIFLMVGSVVLLITGFYRLFFTLFKNWKLGVISLAVIVFGFVYSSVVPDATDFSIIAFAIVGAIGVCADYILYVGIAANFFLIINNIFMTVFGNADNAVDNMGSNDFFYLGNNYFFFPIMNNCSSTDFASHYFWMLAAYLWIRAKKITWGEIFAIGAFDVLIYSFTGSNTTLIGISLLLSFAVFLKICAIFKKNKLFSNDSKSPLKTCASGINSLLAFCFRYSFVVFAVFSIALAVLYNVGNPILYRLNGMLHLRVSLGHKTFSEYGVHLFAPDIPIYGAYSSADGYYNFLDCSYIVLLLLNGILPLLFYLISMTAVQLRQKKYFLGIAILAVCALVCIEEHHLSEIPSNFFLVLLFADMCIDKKVSDYEPSTKKEKKINKTINYSSLVLSAVFILVSVLVNYPRFQAVKELDALDNKAGEIYSALQQNLDEAEKSGEWQQLYSSADSHIYGDLLNEPDDFSSVVGSSWNEMTKDPKSHSYYYVYYDPSLTSSDNEVFRLLINDNVKSIIGNGSIVIEYDAVQADVYSVWYSDNTGCYRVEGQGARNSTREERLKWTVRKIGYYSGDKNV